MSAYYVHVYIICIILTYLSIYMYTCTLLITVFCDLFVIVSVVQW